MNWYLDVLKKYAEFNGRARRMEYWMFILTNFFVALAIFLVEVFVLGGGGMFYGVYSLAVIIPSLAVTIRRLHDTDRTGWWFLIVFVPVIGQIVLLVFMFLDGTAGENQYGQSPKAQAA